MEFKDKIRDGKEKFRGFKIEDSERDVSKEFQENSQKSYNYPKKNTQNIPTSSPESKDEFKREMLSRSEGSQNDLKMKENEGPSNKLSSLNEKKACLGIKEKFEALSSIEKDINDCEEIISAQLSWLSLTKPNEDDGSKTHENPHSEHKGLSELSSEGSQGPSKDGSERNSKMKENISNAKRLISAKSEESLESPEPEVVEVSGDLANSESGIEDLPLEEIIFGLEKTHLTARVGPDRNQKSNVQCRPKPTRIGALLESCMLKRTGFERNDPSIVSNQEDDLWKTNSFGQNLRPSLLTTYQGDTSFSQTNISPLESLNNFPEPVNIDEINPTLPLQNFSPDSSLSSRPFTESLELFSEIPQDTWHYFLTENRSSLDQTQNSSRSSSTMAESQSSLNLFSGENFVGNSEVIPIRHSNMSSFPDQSSVELNYLSDFKSEAVVPSVLFDSHHDSGLQVLDGNDTEEFFKSLSSFNSLSSVRNDSEQHRTTQFQHETGKKQPQVRQRDEFVNERTGYNFNGPPTAFQQSSSPHQTEKTDSSFSSTFSDLNPFMQPSLWSNEPQVRQRDEFVNARTGYTSNEVTSPTTFLQPSSSHRNENSDSSFSSTFSDLNPFMQPSLWSNQPQVRQRDEFVNARTGYTSNEVTSPTTFQQSSSPHRNENSDSSILSDLNPFIQPSLSSKITSFTKNTLKEPSYISPARYASDAQPSKHASFSQIRYKPPVKEPFLSLENKKTISNSCLNDNLPRVSNLPPVENHSERISDPPNRSSSRGGIPQNQCNVRMLPLRSVYQNELMNTPTFKEKYRAEYARFEREIQEENLGTDNKKIIHDINMKIKEKKYSGTNLHVALTNKNIVRFYIIVEKYKEYHQNVSDVNVRDSDGKTVYDIAKEFMEDGIELMDLVVKYLKDNNAVGGIAKLKKERKKKTKQDSKS